MRVARVQFEGNFEWAGRSVDVYPATDENAAYKFFLEQNARPYHLAIAADRLTEDTALKVLAQTYASSVIVGSPDEAFAGFDAEAWQAALLSHPREFEVLRSVAERPSEWGEMAHGG